MSRKKGKRCWVFTSYRAAMVGYQALADTGQRYRLYVFDLETTYYVWARGPTAALSRFASWLGISVRIAVDY